MTRPSGRIQAILEEAKGEEVKDRQRKGLATPEITEKLRWGTVCEVVDRSIHFPTTHLPDAGLRKRHPFRRVIVVQRDLLCQDDRTPAVLVVPCSSSYIGPVSEYDYQIPKDEPTFSKDSVVALTSIVQSILKSEVAIVHGALRIGTRAELMAVLHRNMGFDS